MCEICVALCEEIEQIYGHKVNPEELAALIESSPLSQVEHHPKPKRSNRP